MISLRYASLAFCALLPGLAFAQTTVITGPAPWTVEDEPVVRGYVTREPPPVVEFHQTLTPGSVIPEKVPLKIFPADAPPNLRGYAYFVSVDHKIVVVEADTRRVVHILDMQ